MKIIQWKQFTDHTTGLFFWASRGVDFVLIHQVQKPSPGCVVSFGDITYARTETLKEAQEWVENHRSKFEEVSA